VLRADGNPSIGRIPQVISRARPTTTRFLPHDGAWRNRCAAIDAPRYFRYATPILSRQNSLQVNPLDLLVATSIPTATTQGEGSCRRKTHELRPAIATGL